MKVPRRPASEVYEAAHVPFVTGGPTNPRLTSRGLRFTFRAVYRDDPQGTFAAEYMVRRLGARRSRSSTTARPTARAWPRS